MHVEAGKDSFPARARRLVKRIRRW